MRGNVVGATFVILSLFVALPAVVTRAEDAYAPAPEAGAVALAVIDLGVDFTGVDRSITGVQTFIAALSTDAQQTLMISCAHYLEVPADAQSPLTVPFCDTASQI